MASRCGCSSGALCASSLERWNGRDHLLALDAEETLGHPHVFDGAPGRGQRRGVVEVDEGALALVVDQVRKLSNT